MNIRTLVGLAFVTAAHAAPPSFSIGSDRAVFVDFTTADYRMTFDIGALAVPTVSVLRFRQAEAGRAVFDLVAEPTRVRLDGRDVTAPVVASPDGATKFRVLSAVSQPGDHVLEVEHDAGDAFEYSSRNGLGGGFFMNDLKDRGLLEAIVPASFEYDEVDMHLHAEVVNDSRNVAYEVHTNGELRQQGNVFDIRFPRYFNEASPYFHLTRAGAFHTWGFDQVERSGRVVPVEIYTKHLELKGQFEAVVRDTLTELEADYGPFPHAKVVVYGTKTETGGGMEYAGATVSDLAAIPHELTHSYFGRGLRPANGDAGWIDESLASWRDYGYRTRTEPGYEGANMGGQSPYKRFTDRRAYTLGARFMAYLNSRFERSGGLKAVLREFLNPNELLFVPLTTTVFREHLEATLGQSLVPEFQRYILTDVETDDPDPSSVRYGAQTFSEWVHQDRTREQVHALY